MAYRDWTTAERSSLHLAQLGIPSDDSADSLAAYSPQVFAVSHMPRSARHCRFESLYCVSVFDLKGEALNRWCKPDVPPSCSRSNPTLQLPEGTKKVKMTRL